MLKIFLHKLLLKLGLVKIVLRYSPRGDILLTQKATLLLREMPNLDQDDLEKWYKETQIGIGNNVIMSYLVHKNKQKGK